MCLEEALLVPRSPFRRYRRGCLPRSCRLMPFYLRFFDTLPEELRQALPHHGLHNAGILRNNPRIDAAKRSISSRRRLLCASSSPSSTSTRTLLQLRVLLEYLVRQSLFVFFSWSSACCYLHPSARSGFPTCTLIADPSYDKGIPAAAPLGAEVASGHETGDGSAGGAWKAVAPEFLGGSTVGVVSADFPRMAKFGRGLVRDFID